ncbi:SAM-dependent methyltransferase [Hymenobacter lapidiphilus]|uniref:SAM-dependent methyltransferase n=1 Tax=Hymenobacter lapidiphilus TaxID=2608003 RepID=A0A7Y7U6S7_9BACT|nr:SAM-dependent methyltransferase [Hymenobacter lapidiphilus]NVO33121.1 SAM-dependent methyltransferase [Hymenobacter lapidiphilus]
MTPSSLSNYCDTLYAQWSPEQASWFQPQAAASLRLFAHANLPFDAPIVDVGSGLSPFFDKLLTQGYVNLIATDLSATALHQHRCRLPPAQAERVLWVVDDVTAPQHLPLLDPVLFWHDRALLHGLMSASQTATYCRLLDHMVLAHGWVLLAARAPQSGPPLTDAGLLVQPYGVAELTALLGADYALQCALDEVHETPQGEKQTYTYALFQRNATSRRGAWQ